MKRIFYSLAILFIVPYFLHTDEIVHILQAKETLYGLSRKYGVSYEEIMKYNGITDPSSLSIGLQIRIPGKESASFSYIVKKNDSLWGLARKFDTTKEAIVALNNLESTLLLLGQELRIPGAAPASPPEPEETSDSETMPEPEPLPAVKTSVKTVVSGTGSGDHFWPVEGVVHELGGIMPGVKIQAEEGTPVYAIATGKVVLIQTFLNRGKHVFVQASNNTVYCYGGLGEITVSRNDPISPGTLLGSLEINKDEGKAICYLTVVSNKININPKNAPRI